MEEVDAALEPLCSVALSSALLQEVVECQGVLMRILACNEYQLCEIDRSSALQALGFFRMKTDNRLQCAFVLLHRLVQRLAAIWKVDSSFCDSLHRVVRDSVSFEDLMVFHRRLKSLVFRDKRVILSMFHTGAGFDEMDLTNVYETKVRDVEASVEASMEDDSKTDTITVQTNERQLVTRIQLGVYSGMVECKEVIRWHMGPTLTKTEYETECAKAGVVVGEDVFVFITLAHHVEDFALPPQCGLVTKDNFGVYFGPLASRVVHSLATRGLLHRVDGETDRVPRQVRRNDHKGDSDGESRSKKHKSIR